MKKMDFRIVMDTEIGKRMGTMQLILDGSHVDGRLNLLGKTVPCAGSIDESGRLCLRGKIITRMNEFAYQAIGILQNQELELTLLSAKNKFYLKGTAEKNMGV